MIQEAPTRFFGVAEDVPVMVDVYNQIDPEVRNTVKSNVESWTQGLTAVYDKAVGGVKAIGDKLKTNGIDLATAKRRIEGALKGSKNDIIGLGSTFEGLITGDLMGLEQPTDYVRKANSVYNNVQLVLSSGEAVIKNGDIARVQSIVGFLSDLTGNPVLKMFDLGAEAAILRGVVEEVAQWGIPELIDDVFAGQPSSVVNTVITRAAPKIGYTSDVEVIIKFMEAAGTDVPPVLNPDGSVQTPGYRTLNPRPLLAETPNFATLMLQNYTFVEGTTPGDYEARCARLVLALNTMKPDWCYTARRPNEQAYNLAVMALASEHAKLALQTDPQYVTPLYTAPFYEPRGAQDLAKEMYPGIAIS